MTGQMRFTYIDIAKAIGIYLVILGHVVSGGTPLKTFLYAFHMPLFFILTGMTYRWPSDNNWLTISERLTRYAGRLLIPYILFALIYSELSFPNLVYIGYSSRHTLKLAGALSSLWFLMALFMSHVYLLVLFKVLPKKYISNPFVLLLAAIFLLAIGVLLPHGGKYGYPWMINVAFVGSVFILIGILLCRWNDKYLKLSLLKKLFILLITVSLFIVTIPINNPSPGYVVMADAHYGNVAIFAMTAIFGSVSVIMFSQIMDVFLSQLSFVMWIGKNTLGIFLVHKFFVSGLKAVLIRMGIDYNNIAIACASSVLVLIISCVVVVAINRFIPFLLHYEKR